MFCNNETQHSERLIASKLDNNSEKMKKYQNVLRNYNPSMEKVKETGHNLGRVFNSRRGCMNAMHLLCSKAKLPSLVLKTRPRKLLGSLPLAFDREY